MESHYAFGTYKVRCHVEFDKAVFFRRICLQYIHCESKNWATFIFTITLSNVGRF